MNYSRFNYLITGYPRSGTAWFSSLLSVGDSMCLHEPEAMDQSEVAISLGNFKKVGISSSYPVSIGYSGRLPDKVVVIERDFNSCIHSFIRMAEKQIALTVPDKILIEDKIRLTGRIEDFIAGNPLAVKYRFEDIFYSDEKNRELLLSGIWEYVFGKPPSKKSIAKIRQAMKFNVQLSKLEV